uniref:1-deoxy-D-xylulose-5-phosphate synthase n=1 Tax=Lygus hesperus TaxID=30085 RepID=A0A0A9WYD8_LYGHE
MVEDMDLSPTASFSSISIEELSDPNSFYKDFLEVLNDTRMKTADIDEHISSLNCQTAATTLEAVTLFDPRILTYIHDIEIKGRQMDKLVAATQEMKNDLSKLVDEADTKPIDYYARQIEELGLLHNPLVDI